jgi:formiminoglutamase
VKFQDYLQSVTDMNLHGGESSFDSPSCIYHAIKKEIPEKINQSAINIALIGVPEDRNSGKKLVTSANAIREKLYSLQQPAGKYTIFDLGNFKPGTTIKDTYIGLKDLIEYLLSLNICPLIFGGSQDLTYSAALAMESIGTRFNLVSIDSKIDYAEDDSFHSDSYLNFIIGKNPYLNHFTNIGHQIYFTPAEYISKFNEIGYDLIRLGTLRADNRETEPYLRDAHIISFDVSAIRQSEAPSTTFLSPNGLTADEACQLAYFSGFSNNIKTFGLYNVTSHEDHYQTAHLSAQILWYFILGFSARIPENPALIPSNFKKYIISLNEKDEITFFKSIHTDRWWFEIPLKEHDPLVISCSYNDYLKACNHELPDRLWKMFKKYL